VRQRLLLVAVLALFVVPAAAASGPSVSYTIVSGTPGNNNWYRSPVSAQINVQGAIDSTCPAIYRAQTNADAALDCTATDGTSTVQFHLKFKIDTDAPSVTSAGAARPPDSGEWYNHAVAFGFGGTDATSGIASCSSTTYGGPDTASGSVSGTCTDNAGNVSGATSFPLKYDATPPQVSITPARKPDANGWFNHPVAIAVAGSDATSGIASCTGSTKYAGPDTAGVNVAGSCTDNAGNTASGSLTLKYDSTPPRLQDVSVDLAGASATVTWKQPSDTAAVVVNRTPGTKTAKPAEVYSGRASRFRDKGLRAGVRYRYTLYSRDEAGNVAKTTVIANVRTLYAPAPGARARPGTHLAWLPSSGARYYNLQLFFKGKKVLTAWPLTPTFALPRSWSYQGRHHTLARGSYRWYVWPGRGARARGSYGKLLGSSWFRVR
jgi:hypothetical protein